MQRLSAILVVAAVVSDMMPSTSATDTPTQAPTQLPTSVQDYYLDGELGAVRSPPMCEFDNVAIPQFREVVSSEYQDYVFNGRTCEASNLAYFNDTYAGYPECAIQFINYEGLPFKDSGETRAFNYINGCSSGYGTYNLGAYYRDTDSEYKAWWHCMHYSIDLAITDKMHVGVFQLYHVSATGDDKYSCRPTACHGPGTSDGVNDVGTYSLSSRRKHRIAWFKNMTACKEAVLLGLSGKTRAPTPAPTVQTQAPTLAPISYTPAPTAPTAAPTKDPNRLVSKKLGAKLKAHTRQKTMDALNHTIISIDNATTVQQFQVVLNYTEQITLEKGMSTRSSTTMNDADMYQFIANKRLGSLVNSTIYYKVDSLTSWQDEETFDPSFEYDNDSYETGSSGPTPAPTDGSFRRQLSNIGDDVTFKIEFSVTADAYADILANEANFTASLSELLGYNVTVDAFDSTEVDVDILFPASATAEEIEQVSSELDQILATIRATLSLDNEDVDSTTIDLCYNRDCSERGVCDQTSGNCICEDNWLGANCERECVCENGGWCEEKWCRCKFPYYGETCAEVTQCSDCGR